MLRFDDEKQFLAFFGMDAKGKKISSTGKVVMTHGYRSNRQGWRTFSDDRKYYLKSLWEINYARYLDWLKARKKIFDWYYEPETFRFPKELYDTAPFIYTPDFLVWHTPDTFEWVEVKGWLNNDSKKKLKRFKDCFSEEEGDILLVSKDWFKTYGSSFSQIVPGWEKLSQTPRM